MAGLALLGALVASSPQLFTTDAFAFWLLTALVVLGELRPLRILRRGTEGEITPSTAFAFALLIAQGTAAAVVALALGSLLTDLVRRKALRKACFNSAQYVLSLAAAGGVLALLSGLPRAGAGDPFTVGELPAIVLAGGLFFVLNTFFVATVIALVQNMRVWTYFTRDFVFQASTGGMLLGLSPIIVIAMEFSPLLLPLLGLPLLAVHRGGQQALASEHQALHDALTGLPNRVLFGERIEQALRRSASSGTTTAVLVMDLDGFKEVNDTLGHHHGDLLLQEVGPRLEGLLRAGDTVARLGGDEFAIVLPEVPDPEYALAIAGRVLRALEPPFDVGGLTLELGASIGVTCHPQDGTDADVGAVLRRADIAMYAAKTGRTGIERFAPERDRRTPERLTLASELRGALEQGQLTLHYQPQVSLGDGVIDGVEALVRWEHPARGTVAPSEFIPIAERTGLIEPLTEHVLDSAMRQASAWRGLGLELSVAVNLSARSLVDHSFPDLVGAVIGRWGLPADTLTLEVTESMVMADPVRAMAVLERLSELGLDISLDDFGTGYSSLDRLRRMPVDELKIDRSFVTKMAVDQGDAVIVRSTIDLAHNLGLRVVAEGVECAPVWQRLAELGCDQAQGYYVSRPLPADEFLRWVESASASFRPRGALDLSAGAGEPPRLRALPGGPAVAS